MAEKKYSSRPKVAAIIFIVIAAYLICVIILSFTGKKPQIYEVDKGRIADEISADGIIIRSEQVFYAPSAGQVTRYQTPASKIKAGDVVCALDKTGELENLLEQYASESDVFSGPQKERIRNDLSAYSSNYDSEGFSSIYDTSYAIRAIAVSTVSDVIKNNKDEIDKNTGFTDAITILNSEGAGYIEYITDGFENISEEDILPALENDISNKAVYVTSKDIVSEGDVLYKLINSEIWNIYIRLSDEQIKKGKLEDKSVVYVNLDKAGVSVRGNLDIIKRNNVNYAKITLNKYVMNYAGDRTAHIKISSSEKTGLQIPNSSIIQKECFTIPEDYLTMGGDSSYSGFIVSDEKGERFEYVNILSIKNGVCYIDKTELKEGSKLIMPESADEYILEATALLEGVYNINAGYTQFVPVNIISQNGDYALISESVTGLTLYDRILLTAEGHKENEVVY